MVVMGGSARGQVGWAAVRRGGGDRWQCAAKLGGQW
jgi:hypothetical protein